MPRLFIRGIELAQKLLKDRPYAFQFLKVSGRQTVHRTLSLGRQLHRHTPRVRLISSTGNKAVSLKPVDKLDGSVVADQEPLRNVADCESVPFPGALDREKCLILLGS